MCMCCWAHFSLAASRCFSTSLPSYSDQLKTCHEPGLSRIFWGRKTKAGKSMKCVLEVGFYFGVDLQLNWISEISPILISSWGFLTHAPTIDHPFHHWAGRSVGGRRRILKGTIILGRSSARGELRVCGMHFHAGSANTLDLLPNHFLVSADLLPRSWLDSHISIIISSCVACFYLSCAQQGHWPTEGESKRGTQRWWSIS